MRVFTTDRKHSNLATGGNDRHQRVAILHPKYLPSGISVWSWSNRFTFDVGFCGYRENGLRDMRTFLVLRYASLDLVMKCMCVLFNPHLWCTDRAVCSGVLVE